MKTCLFYTGTTLVAIAAVLTGVVLRLSSIPNDIVIRLDDTTESTFTPKQLTQSQIQTFEKEGVVFAPSLLSEEEAIRLRDAGEYAKERVFSIPKLFGTSWYSDLAFDLWRTSPDVASLAMQALPKVAAPTLSYSKNPQTNNVEFRLLRDAMFQYSKGGAGCGWHVDDAGFWPTEEDRDGPTIWIALDEIKVSEGGGLAVLNRTKFEESMSSSSNVTLEACRQAIAKNTCSMAAASPECYAKMEDSKLEWDMKPGDAIIWNRFTFHRGVAAVNNDAEDNNFVKRRYSIRYMPHGSKAGPMVHPSVGPGKVFDGSPYYPQVWPQLNEMETKALERGLEADMVLSRIIPMAAKLLLKKVFPSISVFS